MNAQRKENESMKKIDCEKAVAEFAYKLVKQNVNCACLFWTYQPKLPKAAEKLKKY